MIVYLVNFIFNFGFPSLRIRKFLSNSLFDFSANLDPNWVIFYSVDLSLSSLSKSIKIISHLNSSSHLIKFQKISQNSLISPWNRPLFTTILLNSWLFDKFGEFGINFDTNWCVINDCIDSFHYTRQGGPENTQPKGMIGRERRNS